MSQNLIPVFYAAAMASGALAAFVLGRLLDRIGLPALLSAFALPILPAPLVFLGNSQMAFAGMILWGIGMGAQDSSLKAVLAGIVPSEKRSTAFGCFDTGFGIAWFLGSAAMGLLYGRSVLGVVLFSSLVQLAAIPVLYVARKWEPV